MSIPLRCSTKSQWSHVGITFLILLLFWVPVGYFVYNCDDGDLFRKFVLKIAVMHVIVPGFVLAFQSSCSIWIVWICGLAIAIPRFLWSVSTSPSTVLFLQSIGSLPRVSGFTDISQSHSRIGTILFQFTAESIWKFAFILVGFAGNTLVAHCGFDWVLVGAMSGLFVSLYETVGSHGDFFTWFLYFASTLIFTVGSGILMGALFALVTTNILPNGFYVAIVFVPWMSLLVALMLRYAIGFWGTIVVPVLCGGYLAAALVPLYRVRDE